MNKKEIAEKLIHEGFTLIKNSSYDCGRDYTLQHNEISRPTYKIVKIKGKDDYEITVTREWSQKIIGNSYTNCYHKTIVHFPPQAFFNNLNL